ncbi:UNVERIFIED_CONTAM: GDSL esterase/lipase [Sesamum latifolium]|uniref:GDSL esterase/lipase n=1 Tax=Sesamum latifolium TaxID=2727402 RepID=A0AAW2XJH3_9LAMI
MATICIPSFLCIIFVFMANFVPLLADDATPVIFVLGDSTADVRTNNFLHHSKATANFPHNGVDFPNSRATGRFSNGFNTADMLAKRFGLKSSPPPFLFLRTLKCHCKKHLFKGVNFASGGAGLLDITGSKQTVDPLSEQITQFASVRDDFTATIGPAATEAILSKSLFFISIGSNDIFGYFKTKHRMPEDKFLSLLISAYSKHITTLYELGARKFGIISVPSVGCCPAQRLVQKHLNGTDGCFGAINDFAQAFHSALDTLLLNISSQLPGMKYSLGNVFQMTLDIIANPELFKFKNMTAACCGHGTLNAQGLCNSTASLCPDRRKYLFWDMVHPTQKASDLAAQTLFNGPQYYVSPINFAQLAKDN